MNKIAAELIDVVDPELVAILLCRILAKGWRRGEFFIVSLLRGSKLDTCIFFPWSCRRVFYSLSSY